MGIQSDLLTKEELASELRVSPRTISRLEKKGLPYLSVGSKKRFNYDLVEAWLSQNPNIQYLKEENG